MFGLFGGILSFFGGVLHLFRRRSEVPEAVKTSVAMWADKDVAVQQLKVIAQEYHDHIDMAKSMRVTQWLIAFALLPALLHQGMIFLDSTPFLGHIVGSWSVPAAPEPYNDREWQMIASLLGIQSLTTLGMGLTRILIRKH